MSSNLYAKGIGNFFGWYITSSEFNINNAYVYSISSWYNGFSSFEKYESMRIRAVRNF
jgi:hypothetical protein